MLRISVNRGNVQLSYTPIAQPQSGKSECYLIEDENVVAIATDDAISIFHNPEVHFIRDDGNIHFHDERKIVGTGDGFVYVESFPNIEVHINSIEDIKTKRAPDSNRTTEFSVITLYEPHNNVQWRGDIEISEIINDNVIAQENGKKRCAGDYVLYNYFLYRAKYVSDGKYVFSGAKMLNSKQKLIIVTNDGNIEAECIVPIRYSEGDINGMLILDKEKYRTAGEALSSGNYLQLFIEDNRFYFKGKNKPNYGVSLEIRSGVGFYLEHGNLRVSIPISEDFAADMMSEDVFDTFSRERAEKAINEIVDYEKAVFVPCFGENKLYNTIKYNIRLRDRSNETWTVEDNKYWFYYPDRSLTPIDGSDGVNSDIIGWLGMDDDDVYYQKSKVKNTFLRVSIYNTNDRRTQQLLYTSKIYLNSGKLYGKYLANVQGYNKSDMSYDYTLGENSLTVDFTCSSRFNSDSTSEGFYMYLFPSNLINGDDGIVYMKAEFNNAKYGYTVPLTLPRDTNGNILQTPPLHYIKDEGGKKSPDMGRLREDMFIPIRIFKNDDGKYYWSFNVGGLAEKEDIEITLFEPRINGTE